MPTGYTVGVMDGKVTEFREFALQCARAFGALIEMRDDAMDAPIPAEFKPSNHYAEEKEKAQAEFDRLAAMSPQERLAFGTAKKAEKIKYCMEWLEKDKKENERLLAMKTRVLAWEPPSPDHQDLRHFMLEQLDISLNDTDYIVKNIETFQTKDPLTLYSEARDAAQKNIIYFAGEHAKEISRAANRTAWLQRLRASLEASTEVRA